MRMTLREVGIGSREQCLALGDEPAQHRVDHATGARLADDAAGIYGQMHLRLGRATRVLDLVRGGNQQRRERRRQLGERTIQQRRKRGLQPQVPAQCAECDGAHRGPILAFGRRLECDVRGPTLVAHLVYRARGGRQRFGSWRMAGTWSATS